MRTMIAAIVCCAVVIAIGLNRYLHFKTVTAAPVTQQLAESPLKGAVPTREAVVPVADVGGSVTSSAMPVVNDAFLAQAPAEAEAATKAKAEPKKRAAPSAKKEAGDAKKAAAAKAADGGNDLKSIKKELAQARRDRTALDKRITALEKQVEELEASTAKDTKSAKGVKSEKSSQDDKPKAEKSKAAPTKASATKRAKTTRMGAAA